MSSPARDHRMVRRMASIPRSIMGGISRAMEDGIGLVRSGRGRRRSNHHPNLHVQPQYSVPPLIPEEWAFLDAFERQYGTKHPFFYACRLAEAVKLAQQDGKFVFMFLHSPDHPFSAVFCRETLCSDIVTEFLDVNFVCWGGIADRGEGLSMVSTLRPATFPCCAVVAPANGDSMTLLQQLEGPVSAAELVEILQRTLEEQGLTFGSGKAKQEEKIRADRRLREEQDAAYLAALQIDNEKEKLKKLPSREGIQRPVEAQNARNYGKLSSNVTKQNNKSLNHSIGQNQEKGIASRGNDSHVTQILIRFPNGERREHSFLCGDKIRSIFSYIDSLGMRGIENYRLISNFPRRAYGVDQLGMTLKDAGLHPKASLFLEPM